MLWYIINRNYFWCIFFIHCFFSFLFFFFQFLSYIFSLKFILIVNLIFNFFTLFLVLLPFSYISMFQVLLRLLLWWKHLLRLRGWFLLLVLSLNTVFIIMAKSFIYNLILNLFHLILHYFHLIYHTFLCFLKWFKLILIL